MFIGSEISSILYIVYVVIGLIPRFYNLFYICLISERFRSLYPVLHYCTLLFIEIIIIVIVSRAISVNRERICLNFQRCLIMRDSPLRTPCRRTELTSAKILRAVTANKS